MKSTREDIINELHELLWWLSETKEDEVTSKQEEILQIISLITNKQFRKAITKLRNKYEIPEHWHTPAFWKLEKTLGETEEIFQQYSDYIDTHPETPTMPYDEAVITFCNQFNLDFKKYGPFILDHLYYGHTWPSRPPQYEWFEYLYVKDEYRHKTNIVLDYHDNNGRLRETTQKAFIRFYGDTTINQIVEFLDKNQLVISQIQKELTPYPHQKKYGKFARDVKIYIKHLLGQKTSDICFELAETVALSDKDARQIIADVKNKIKLLQQG